jgi:NAD(P)-dependent dehydrogenase (short-subunit alcohol dehydrogenase family)
MYPKPLDFTSTSLSEELGVLYEYLASRTSHLDVLVNCAAQTIQGFNAHLEGTTTGQTNRYGDPARYREGKSSWNLEFHEVSYAEWVSVFAVNAIAPPMLTSQMLPLLQGRNHDPAQGELPPAAYLLNVHAREGVFEVRKSKFHVHTNMAKAALAMFTKCVSRYKLLDSGHRRIFVHGIDPGWISTDEYHAGVSPWVISPIDEVDGAARVLQPVWEQLKSKQKTRRHFYNLLY